MPIEITMPKLSDTMTDGTLVKWLKKENDKINPGDIIAEIETDKATQDLEVFDAGTIAKIVIPEGGKAPVGALIVVIALPTEDAAKVRDGVKGDAPAAAAPVPAAPPKPQAAPVPALAVAAPKEPAPAPVTPAPVATRERANVDVAVEEPVAMIDHLEGAEQIENIGRIRVSPLARKIADERGVDLNLIKGSGPEGRIVKRDVLDAAVHPRRISPAQRSTGPGAPAPIAAVKLESKRVPLSNMRQTIAKRLVQAKQTIPHFYVTIDVIMDKLIEVRQAANEQIAPEKLTVTDFIARAVCMTLSRMPQVNTSFGETEQIHHGTIDLGIAVALDDGLVVPVIRAAHTKGLRQLSTEIKTLSAGAKANKLKLNQITGSTFTISNLGMFGIKEFAAIINPPESAILAVGGTEARPIVCDGQIVPAQVMTLTLSVDHRSVDGATAAKFLVELKSILENPLSMLSF